MTIVYYDILTVDTLADTLQQKNKGLSLEIEKLSSQHDTNQAKKGEDFKNDYTESNVQLIISDAEIEELTEQLKEKGHFTHIVHLIVVYCSFLYYS